MSKRSGQFQAGKSGNPKGRPPKTKRLDGWVNVMTGLGTARYDKTLYNEFSADILTTTEAAELWRGNDLAARIIELPPSEAMREGFDIKMEDKALAADVVAKLDDLDALNKVYDALCYQRAYGGAAAILGVDDRNANLSEPLVIDKVKALNWLTVLEPDEAQAIYWYANPLAAKFGEVEIYDINPSTQGAGRTGIASPNVRLHESRMLTFPGNKVSRKHVNVNAGWGDSILNRINKVLRNFDVSWESAGVLVHDFAQAVFKFKGLAELVAMDNADAIRTRLQLLERSRSVLRGLVIDADESFERQQTPVSGLPELLDRFAQRLSAASGIPITLLMGVSPAGLNATGASDVRFFYDKIKQYQTNTVKPRLERLIRVVFASLGAKEPEEWQVEFRPLWQPTAKEKAEERYIVAQTDAIYLSNGVLSPDEVARNRFTDDGYSADTRIDWSERLALEPEIEEPEESESVPESGDVIES